jgi:hypothetical protein
MDLTKLSKVEHRKVITTLAKKPLAELRRRQSLTEGQLLKAPHEAATKNLLVMQAHLEAAIMKKVFG